MDGHYTRVVIISGGMDSYTLLHEIVDEAKQRGDEVRALSFDYGQRHRKELAWASIACKGLGIDWQLIDLSMLKQLAGHSALLGTMPVPHGHYAAETMKQTVVPGRNTVMLALALAYAEGLEPRRDAIVYYGAHAGDHAIYPDCRPEFVHSMSAVFQDATEGRVHLNARYIKLTKGGILARGLAMQARGLALEYAWTWSCYEGGDRPCGKCGACVERAEAFAENGVPDPLLAA